MSRTIVIASLIFLLASCKTKNNLYLFFDKVDGLSEKSAIVSRGVKIGEVSDLSLKDSGVIVQIALKNKYKIPRGSNFKISYDNVLTGRNAIDVILSNSSEYYSETDTIRIVNLNNELKNNVAPVLLDSVSQKKVVKVFEQLDTMIKILKH